MLDRQKIKKLIQPFSLSECSVLVARIMLRSVPFIENKNSLHQPFSYWLVRGEKLFNVFDAMRTAVAFASLNKTDIVEGNLLDNEKTFHTAFTASDEFNDYRDSSDGDNIDVAFVAAHAVYVSVYSYFEKTDVRIKPLRIERSAIDVIQVALSYDPDHIFYNEFLFDMEKIKNKDVDLIRMPLWSNIPSIWHSQLVYFNKIIIELNPSFTVWKRWYEQCIDGVKISSYLFKNQIFLSSRIEQEKFQMVNAYLNELWDMPYMGKYVEVIPKIIYRTDNIYKELHDRLFNTITGLSDYWNVQALKSCYFTKFYIDSNSISRLDLQFDDEWKYDVLKKYHLQYIMTKVPVDDEGDSDENSVIFKFWAKKYPEIYTHIHYSLEVLNLEKTYPLTWYIRKKRK